MEQILDGAGDLVSFRVRGLGILRQVFVEEGDLRLQGGFWPEVTACGLGFQD